MGQIFNRIARIAKANFNNRKEVKDAESYINQPDNELKKQFDNLGSRQNSAGAAQADNSANMDIASALRTLGLDAEHSSPEEIKSAYKKNVAEYHPDKVAHLGEEIRELSRKKILQINMAYELLKKSKGM
jgi:DnaJ like chaperone protein